MAATHNEKTIYIPCVAAGTINLGHCVDLTSWTEAGGYVVTQSTGANTAWGVYCADVNPQDAVIYDHVQIAIFGPCKAWCDGAITVAPPQAVSNDTDGHVVAETTDKKRALGFIMATNGATENYGEVFVNPHLMSI